MTTSPFDHLDTGGTRAPEGDEEDHWHLDADGIDEDAFEDCGDDGPLWRQGDDGSVV